MGKIGLNAMLWIWLACSCFFAAAAVAQSREGYCSERRVSGTAWIEVIEKYDLPCDPWLPTIEGQLEWENPRLFRGTLAEYQKRRDRLAQTSDPRNRGQASLNKWKEGREASILKSFSSLQPVTIVRAWDGIQQCQMYFSLGKGQAQLARQLVDGKVYLVEFDIGRPYDDLQGRRETVSSVEEEDAIPSEFARWADVNHRYASLRFGSLKSPSAQAPTVIAATKVGGVGDGLYAFRIRDPVLLDGISLSFFPWFCEYEVYELDVDGARGNPAMTSARAPAVFAPVLGSTPGREWQSSHEWAEGRFRVDKPSPWGYEIEVVRWFGMVPVTQAAPQQPSSPSAPAPAAPRLPRVPAGLTPPTPGTVPPQKEPPALSPAESPVPPPEPTEPQP